MIGDTTVTCHATDTHNNISIPVSFIVTVNYDPIVTSTRLTSTSSNGLFITVTGGELINLGCLKVVNAFNIKVTFHNLCGYQAIITSAGADTLPEQLPNGLTFVKGLNINVLFNGQLVSELPTGTGIQLDYPIPASTQDQYAALLWDNENKVWLDVTQLMKDDELMKTLSTDTEDGLYQIVPTETLKTFYRILTIEKSGTIVFVKK